MGERSARLIRVLIAVLYVVATTLAVAHVGRTTVASTGPSGTWIQVCTGNGVQLVRLDTTGGLGSAVFDQSASPGEDRDTPPPPLKSAPPCPVCNAAPHVGPVLVTETEIPPPSLTNYPRPSVAIARAEPPRQWRFVRPENRGPPVIL